MTRTMYYAWLFTIVVIFASTLFTFVRRGLSTKVIIGIILGSLGLFFLKRFKTGRNSI